MKSHNPIQAVPVRRAQSSLGAKLIAINTAALATGLMGMVSASAQVHAPLKTAEASQISPIPAAELLGEPKGSEVSTEIEARVMAGRIDDTLGRTVSESAKDAARQAYAQGIFAPIWTRPAAEKLVAANRNAMEGDLDSRYSDAEVSLIVNARFNGSASEQAAADLQLSALWLQLAAMKSDGLLGDGSMIASSENRTTQSELVQALRKAGKADPVAEMQPLLPPAPQYTMLESALKQYRRYSEQGGWMRIRNDDEMLEPGMTDARVPALRKRLAAEGYVEKKAFPSVYAELLEVETETSPLDYDKTLEQQVKAFQAAHGLMQDGILGPSTLAALNESVDSKIDRIEAAMDYWQDNPNLGDRYIWVNIPSYRAEAWTGDRRDIAMDTIVGKKRTPTTAFSDEIEYIVVNPKWFLPIGLFKRQKLRKLRKDPGYAAANNYIVYDRASGAKLDPYAIDWNEKGVSRRIRMVQTPGPHNALGQLKIIFPNRHSIYLHDTPAGHLFDNDVRSLSSGCVRLHDPVKMANWLTDGDPKVDTDVFNATLASRERERFYLDTHVNVHLTYLPAVVSPEGRFEFPADIYREFKKPTFAEFVYPDDIEGMKDYADFGISRANVYGQSTTDPQ